LISVEEMKINYHFTKADKIALVVGLPILALIIFWGYENALATSNFTSFYGGFLGMFTVIVAKYILRRTKKQSINSN
jgi:hypothetical protein